MEDDTRTQRYRTTDVQSDAGSFNDLLLPQPLVIALAEAGFLRPSPVQKAAIPIGRVGSDVIVQAKSGTGKTAVFATILLERVTLDTSTPQALVLAPTRELAIQSHQVIERIAAGLPEPAPAAAVFVGGLPTAEDEKRLRRTCHIVVGTPGRISALISSGALLLGRLKCVVLDEADSLLGEGFYADVAWIMQQLPAKKQVLAFSATFTAELLADLEPLMRRPQKVLLCEETVSLLGIRQYYKLVGNSSAETAAAVTSAAEDAAAIGELTPPAEAAAAAAVDSDSSNSKLDLQQQQQQSLDVRSQQALLLLKVEALLHLLSTVTFHQAVVFCNKKPAAEWLSRRLTAAGCPATYLSADLPQTERMVAMEAVRGFRVRTIVSTDVMARGVDFDRVNLVVNVDLPQDAATYVHRVGRTGRFGSRGVSVALVTEQELTTLRSYLTDVRFGDIEPLPDVIPDDFYTFALESDWEQQALQQLLQAPVTTPPTSPPPMSKQKKKQQAASQQQQQVDDEPEECEQRHNKNWANAAEEQQQQQRDDDRVLQQQQQQQYASDAEAAAAWDAWADYYRSQGYSYPYVNPFRGQQQPTDVSSSSRQCRQHEPPQQQQQQQPWLGHSQSCRQHRVYPPQQQKSWVHPHHQQQQCTAGGSRAAPYCYHWNGYSAPWQSWQQQDHLNRPFSSSSCLQQQQRQPHQKHVHSPGLVRDVNQTSSNHEDAAESEAEQCEIPHEDEEEDDVGFEFPSSDDECDPRAVLLLSRLQVTEAAAAAAAAAGQGKHFDDEPVADAAARHASSSTHKRAEQHGAPAVLQQHKQQPQGAVDSCDATNGYDRPQMADGVVCMSCWYAAYAAWQRDYESWRQQYSAWWYSLHPM